MSKINLDFNTNRALGKYFPSVMINTISIENRGSLWEGTTETGSTFGEESDIIITANLIINITKPKEMQDPAAWVSEFLGSLYLYAYISGYPTINNDLANKKLFLKDLQQAFALPSRETLTSSTPGFSIIHEYMKEAFISHEWGDWMGAMKDTYMATEESALAAGIEDPECVWHYVFYGNHGATGPWWNTSDSDGWDGASGGDLDSTKTLYSDIYHTEEIEYDFQSNDVDKSFMKAFLATYLYYLSAVSHSWTTDEGEEKAFDVNLLARKIPLSDFLTGTEPNQYGANFFIQNVYDEEGNELIQISNINIKFDYGISFTTVEKDDGTTYEYSFIQQRLEDTPNVFFIATIGIDTDAPIGIDETPRSIYNSYFGNISYENILENNEVPTQIVETFHESASGAPYDDIPLSNLDGRYHAIKPVTHDLIHSQVQSLIDNYEHRRDDQLSLDRNIKQLESIIEEYKKSPNILRILAGYQQSYSPKDASKPAGWFYNDFTVLVTNLSKRLGYQPRLDKKLSRVGIVTDYRSLAINETYYAPTPKWSNTGALLFNTDDDTFIPSKWSRMSRQTMMADVIPEDMFAGFGSDNEQFRQDLLQELETSGQYSAWIDAGFTAQDINAWVEAATAQMTLREGSSWIEGDTESALIDDMHDPFGVARLEEYDYVVQNAGHFWFDWEKALYTQSNIAQVLPLNKLGRYFRLRVPYKYFPVTECKMTRTELDLSLGLDGDEPTVEDWLQSQHTTVLKTVMSGDLPGQTQELTHETSPIISSSDYAYGFPRKTLGSVRSIQSVDSAGSATGITVDADGVVVIQGDQIYSNPSDTHTTAGDFIEMETVEAMSYLKFVISDSSVNSSLTSTNAYTGDTGYSLGKDTLIGYGAAIPGEAFLDEDGGTSYSAVPVDSALNLSYKVRNGYRLMAFEYKDIMDDDVAFYNTMAYQSQSDQFPNRQEALRQLNSAGQDNSEYKVEIEVQDKTMAFYTDVFWPFIKASYDDFYEYYLFAEEFCSFNNLNGQFNQFFVDAINNRYADSSEKRWVRAALVATLLKEILFRSAESTGPATEEALRDLMETEVLKIINNISPEEGNLEALRFFNCRFGNYMTQINPYVDRFREFCTDVDSTPVYDRAVEISALTEDEIEDGASDWDKIRASEKTHSFSNYLQIDSVIYGDYMLNAQMDSDTSFDLASKGIHPLGIPPGHLYLTAGPPSSVEGGYSARRRILVHCTGDTVPAGLEESPSGWYFLESLLTDIAYAKLADTVLHDGSIERSRKIQTPVLLDFGQNSVLDSNGDIRLDLTEEEVRIAVLSQGSETFSKEMLDFMLTGEVLGGLEYDIYGLFRFVILDEPTRALWASTYGPTGGSHEVPDPVSGVSLKIDYSRAEQLGSLVQSVELASLFMGDYGSDGSDGLIHGGSYFFGAEGLWFPNWANSNLTVKSVYATTDLPAHRFVTDWRFFEPAFLATSAEAGTAEISTEPDEPYGSEVPDPVF